MNTRFSKAAAAALTCALVGASVLLVLADVEDQYSDWSAPVNLGPILNTTVADVAPVLSDEGLSLYFTSNRPGGFGGQDIWVSKRASVNDPWEPPQNLGPNVNTSSEEQTPRLSADGRLLFFQSNRPGGFGGFDLYVSRRHNKRDDFAWQSALNLGSEVNTFADENGPAPFEDDVTGTIILHFASNRPGGMGAFDVYASTLQPDETFGPPVLVEELNSPYDDGLPGIRRDGLEMFLVSSRPGTLGSLDLYVSTRGSTSEPWSEPVNLGPVVNSAAIDGSPAPSFDGTELYFWSNRPGSTLNIFGNPSVDLWVTTRTKLKGPN